ncbi:hypothetical protein A6X21_00495 [Planctopirus hydrillae]|uniref:Uncharacterized protein n=1 Tax=Planctopirus hydrillae TaxID=1841610 RepID=A0A1C3EAY1_9PLAN|nr:hypothetical protein A6X21_00495 [Planctopirus hydrillae]
MLKAIAFWSDSDNQRAMRPEGRILEKMAGSSSMAMSLGLARSPSSMNACEHAVGWRHRAVTLQRDKQKVSVPEMKSDTDTQRNVLLQSLRH